MHTPVYDAQYVYQQVLQTSLKTSNSKKSAVTVRSNFIPWFTILTSRSYAESQIHTSIFLRGKNFSKFALKVRKSSKSAVLGPFKLIMENRDNFFDSYTQ